MLSGMSKRMVRWAAAVGLVASLVLVAAVPAGAARAPKLPNLVGTWEGDYRFPSTDNTGVNSHEKLVIDFQSGELLWGHDEFVDKTGAVVRIPLRGSIDADGKGFGLAETGGLFTGRVTGKRTMVVRFFLTTSTYTSFHATLTRAK